MYGAPQGKISQNDNRVCLEVRVEFLSFHTEGQRCLLETNDRVSASNRDLLMKNIGLCLWFSYSLNKAALIETYEISR